MIGYIGLGAMGRALATRLIDGHDLLVWDLDPRAMAAMVADGARAAGSLADMADRCDVVLLCLPKSGNVEQALFGAGGLAERLAPGSVVIDQTSGVPETTRAFADRLAGMGIAMIDAPVAGGVPSAIAGQITIMASGPADAFERARPVLRAISTKLFHCSDQVGDGQATKAINNLINTGYRMMTLELLGLACRLGCSPAALTERLNAGAARSFVTQRLLPAIVGGRSSSDFALGLMCKDVNQAADIALAARVAMPVSDTARGLMHLAYVLLGRDSQLDDLVPFMARIAGVDFAATNGFVDTDIDAEALIEAVLAAGNRAIAAEGFALASRIGLSVEGFAPVIAAGSGASAQADRLLAAGNAPEADALAALEQACRRGADLGVPLTMTNQIRARVLAARTAAED